MVDATSGEKYSVTALMALYDLEPTLRDIYVEGRTDAVFFDWYFSERGLDARAYAIDDRVEFLPHELEGMQFDSGCRGRVISLAVHASRSLGTDHRGITCVVDADFGRVIGPMPIADAHLLHTDGAALECYALQERPLTKLLRLGLGLEQTISARDVLAAICPALIDLYLARAVLYALGVRCIDAPMKLAKLDSKGVSLSLGLVIERSIGTLSRSERPVAAEDAIAWAEDLRPGTDSELGRGHDIALMLSACLGLKPPLGSPQALEAAMRTSLDIDDLVDQPLFVKLEERLAS